MKNTIISMLVGTALSGCAVLDEILMNTEQGSSHQQEFAATTPNLMTNSQPLEASMVFQQQFGNDVSHNQTQANPSNRQQYGNNLSLMSNSPEFAIKASNYNINHYTQGLMHDLVANLQYVNSTTPVAVVSFVMLDSNYNQASLLGNQIAESLIHEIHKFGIPVIDFKTTGYIRITEQGDFAFTKDYEELSASLAARYIVGGTMVKHKDGYLVNARIIGLQSKAVVASAQSFIPNEIANALMENNSDKISNGGEFEVGNAQKKLKQSIRLTAN